MFCVIFQLEAGSGPGCQTVKPRWELTVLTLTTLCHQERPP